MILSRFVIKSVITKNLEIIRKLQTNHYIHIFIVFSSQNCQGRRGSLLIANGIDT